MDILDSMTTEQLRGYIRKQQGAMMAAHHALVDGRRVGDAMKHLKPHLPTEDSQFPEFVTRA